jgi:hypothetical protein
MKDFTFEGAATVKRVDPFVSKNGKSMPTLVLETDGQYPQLVPCKAFRDMAEEVEALKPGQIVKVRCRVGGREWNGKVYADIVLEKLDVVGEADGKQPEAPADDDDQPPF